MDSVRTSNRTGLVTTHEQAAGNPHAAGGSLGGVCDFILYSSSE